MKLKFNVSALTLITLKEGLKLSELHIDGKGEATILAMSAWDAVTALQIEMPSMEIQLHLPDMHQFVPNDIQNV
jgi:hypothetical protein